VTRPSPFIIIAIDGGAASGKSSSARALSERFDLMHVDTGSYYRALTAALLRAGVAPGDPAAVSRAVATLRLDTRFEGRRAAITINGQALTEDEIRSPSVNQAVSHFSALPAVRGALLDYQRDQARVAAARGYRGLVMEGRDIGSVIFPEADLRVFLHADPAERARRRASEGRVDQVAERDRLDSSRAAAPLTCPPGALDLDSTHLTLEQVVEHLAARVAPLLAPTP
jgi:CMP/dCMP kinase